jgi:hypothetical protein
MGAGNGLKHHGIKGMHWGVRRTRAQLDSASEDYKKASGHRTTIKEAGGTHALQNDELQFVITRMNLEQQYSRLTSQPSKLKEGHDTVRDILKVAKTVQEVHGFVKSPLGKSIKTGLVNKQRKKFANTRGLPA